MTTNTTPSTASQAPAVTIADDDEFIDLMHALSSVPSSVYAGSEFSKVISYIDAKLAQARQDGYDNGANDIQAISETIINRTVSRATAAEAKLEAIRQGVRGCVGFGFDKDGPNWISRQQVLALFQPQPQADESGLPG